MAKKRINSNKSLTALFLQYIFYNSIVLYSKFSKYLAFYGRVSYASPPIWKLYPCSDIISQLYKLTFYDSHLSHNIFYGSITTIWVFCLP